MTFRPERWLDSLPAGLVEMDNYFFTVRNHMFPFLRIYSSHQPWIYYNSAIL